MPGITPPYLLKLAGLQSHNAWSLQGLLECPEMLEGQNKARDQIGIDARRVPQSLYDLINPILCSLNTYSMPVLKETQEEKN